jgi:hypothetical protein
MERIFQIVPALAAQDIPAVVFLVERCTCCWRLAHPGQDYPASWSSTLCLPHAEWTRDRRAARKLGGRELCQ